MMTNFNYIKNNKGFTIVELIVVVVVIAILASITLVSYSYLQSRAVDTATTANVKQYVDALEMYSFEHGGYPVSAKVCIGAEPTDSYGGCGKYDYVGSSCADLGLEDGGSSIETTWSQEFNDALSKYMGEGPNSVQASPYKTLITDISGCKIYLTASSPTYVSAKKLYYSDTGVIVTTGTGTSNKAYYITYAVSKDGKCHLPDSVRQTDILFGSEATSCVKYGGDVTPNN